MQDLEFSRKILNVVVVGQSGVGKSSFLNYVADNDVFPTGVGGAVTKGYFHTHKVSRNRVEYILYDTEGLEPGKVKEWENNILSEIKKRDNGNDISDWFHSLLFCISAESKRIQPFEIDAIKRMSQFGHVMVLLTKKDKVNGDVLEDMKTELLRQTGDQIDVLSVCSVSQKFRNGKTSNREGLDDVLKMTFVGLWKKMSKMMPKILLSKISFYDGSIDYGKNVKSYISWALLNGIDGLDKLKSFYALCDVLGLNATTVDNDTAVSNSQFMQIKKIDCYLTRDGFVRATGRFSYKDSLNLPTTPSKDILDWGLFRGGLQNYLIDWSMFYYELQRALRIFNPKEISNQILQMIQTCLSFYADIMGRNLGKKVSIHDINSRLAEINMVPHNDELCDSLSKVRSAIREVNGCIFFNGTERDELIKAYGDFKNDTDSFIRKYEGALTAASQAIQQELRSFADYTLRDSFVGDSQDPLTEFIKIIRNNVSFNEWNRICQETLNCSNNQMDSIKKVLKYGI